MRLGETAEGSLSLRWDRYEFAEFLDRVPVLAKQPVKAACFRAGRLTRSGVQIFAHAMAPWVHYGSKMWVNQEENWLLAGVRAAQSTRLTDDHSGS